MQEISDHEDQLIKLIRKTIAGGLSNDVEYKEIEEMETLSDWTIDRLLKVENTQKFVDVSYQVLLKRRIGIVELRRVLRDIRMGSDSKILWLSGVALSDEAKQRHIHWRWGSVAFKLAYLIRAVKRKLSVINGSL